MKTPVRKAPNKDYGQLRREFLCHWKARVVAGQGILPSVVLLECEA